MCCSKVKIAIPVFCSLGVPCCALNSAQSSLCRKRTLLIHDWSQPNGGNSSHPRLPNQAWLRRYLKARIPELLFKAQRSIQVQHYCLEPEQMSHRFLDQEFAFSQNLEFGILGQ
jgi:hypothetical protein